MRTPLFLLFLFFCFPILQAQQSRVHGRVEAPSGEPLAGVTVALRDASIGTATDARGLFSLSVPAGTDSLVFSYTGYQTRVMPISSGSLMQVVLKPEIYQLGEVTVVGFGEQENRQLTSAISSTGSESFENIPVTSWQQALQGRLPGLSITSASGGLDAASSIRVRGVGSISAGNQPLIVVDGIILSGLGGMESLGYFTNPFIGLNPEDIASVEVLKDAAATAVYGARGSNGVILITTKQGAYASDPEVRLSYYAGFSEISRRYDLLSGPEYAAFYNEAALNAGAAEAPYQVDEQPHTDWQSLLTRRGFLQQAQASVQGGSRNLRYFVAGTFRDEDSYLITTGLQRYSLRANLAYRLGERWEVGLSLAPSRVVDRRTGNKFTGSPFGWAAWYYPNVEAFDAQGEPIREPLTTSIGSGGFTGNPLLTVLDQEIELTTQQLLARGHLQFSPSKNITLRTEVASEMSQEEEWGYNGPATFFGRNGGSGNVQNQDINSLQWTTQADWRLHIQTDHRLHLTAGTQYVHTRFSGQAVWGSGFPSEQIRYLNSTAQVNEFFSWRTSFAFLGYFGRVNYSFRDRYLLGLSARYDGSSRFGADRRFGFFPAVSAGWIAVDEARSSGKILQFLKIRASIGLTGNAEIGDFVSRGLVQFNQNYLGEPGFMIQSLENPGLGWEKSLHGDIGLDFSVLGSRIRGSLDFFVRDTRDLLMEAPVPATSGVSSLLENAGSIRNSGLELSLDIDVLRGPLQWTMQLNAATLRNRIRSLVDLDQDGEEDEFVLNGRNLFRVGQPVGAFFLVKYAGVDPATGDALFYDLEGNTVVNQAPAENRQVVGKPIPSLTGGINQRFQYKRFDLTAFFHFKMGHQIYLIQHQSLASNMASGFNQLRTQLDAWTPENPNTEVPQARLFQVNGSQPSTRYLHDADFLRLQNLTFGYTLPRWGKGDSRLRIYAAVQNLFTLTAFPGLDPDSEFYPVQQAAQGAVLYNLPASRTFTFGMNLHL